MTPGARHQAAIEILDRILAGEAAERALTRWARASRFAGSKDRAAVRDLVFDALRQRRSRAHRMGGETGRTLILGGLAIAGTDPEPLFSGEGHAPAPLDPEEVARLSAPPSAPPPPAVAGDYPDWLAPELARSLGDALPAVMEALRHRAPLDLRVNLLKSDRAGALRALSAEGIEAEALDTAPTALRVTSGARRVAQTDAYREGLVELQDVSSQAVAIAAAPRPGETVLDYCSGGGGKALALAALMGGAGRIVAHDAELARMKDLPARAARAGATVEIAAPGTLPSEGWADLVLVDAPCSGSGAWRRQPDAKWRLDAGRLVALTELQDKILAEAAAHLRPGGRLVYATCSLLAVENEDRVAAFLARHPDLRADSPLRLSPLGGGDGFFAVRILRPPVSTRP
ncbi:MAG: RsmB/NOP family class I SAM-dependent RNA methyltransferase [Pseudomonadota bacterium]